MAGIVAITLEKAKKAKEAEGSDDDSEEASEGASEDEVMAMKMFEKASTPEAKAEALKDFLKACGAY